MVVIGSGNVAWHLVNAFSRAGIQVLQILAHNETTAHSLSKEFSVPYITDPGQMEKGADIYLLTVQDDRIKEAANTLGLSRQLLVHTSGFSSLGILSGASSNTGVIWPLQTLTTGKKTDFSQVPFFIEGNTPGNTEKLASFASRVSGRVIVSDSQARQKIHLAAVIASNLTNQLYTIAATILEQQDIPFNVLAPLISETAQKANQQDPMQSQTGPAIREDQQVITRHLEMLRNDPSFREIYRLITENIKHLHSNKNE